MFDQNHGEMKQTRQKVTAEAKSDGANQQVTPAEAQTTPVRQESEADKLLRKIFFRSGPLPMAPGQEPEKYGPNSTKRARCGL